MDFKGSLRPMAKNRGAAQKTTEGVSSVLV
jgi:hypothetical protein